MGNVKSISTTDRLRVRSFGQNVAMCTAITGRSLESIAKDSGVTVSFLKGTLEGKGELTEKILSAVASEIGLRSLDLMGTHGGEAKRRTHFEKLLESSSELLVVDLYEEPSLPRMSAPRIKPPAYTPIVVDLAPLPMQRTETVPIHVYVPPVEETLPLTEVNLDTPKVPWPKPEVLKPTTRPRAPRREYKRAIKSQMEIPGIPTEESGGINWDKQGLVARLATGEVFDLTQKELRVEIARRIRFLKGHLTFVELIHNAKLNKVTSWISALEGGGSTLCRDDVEKIAVLCEVTVQDLLLGTGIVPLIAKESAESWLARYKEAMPGGDELHVFAHHLKDELAKWPRPIQNMIVNFLKESLE